MRKRSPAHTEEAFSLGLDLSARAIKLLSQGETIAKTLRGQSANWQELIKTNQAYSQACTHMNKILNRAAPNEPARKNVGLKVKLLEDRLKRQYRPFSEVAASLDSFVSDVKAVIQLLPDFPDFANATGVILEHPLIIAGGYTGGPPGAVEKALAGLLDGLRDIRMLLSESKEYLSRFREAMLEHYLRRNPERSETKQLLVNCKVGRKEFYCWKRGELASSSSTTRSIERFLMGNNETDPALSS